jgi:glycyl-tRNA synthetase (class II)
MKTYLGDSVYAEVRPYNVILTTENGAEASNTIYLEPEVLEAFLRFIERAKKETHADPSTPL